jgi:hypothetical protein
VVGADRADQYHKLRFVREGVGAGGGGGGGGGGGEICKGERGVEAGEHHGW